MRTADAYRDVLLRHRTELVAQLGATVNLLALSGRVAEDDQTQQAHDEFLSISLNGLGYRKLRLVDQALERLEAGEYGECVHCGCTIPPRRLAAIPWAQYCVPCQEGISEREEGNEAA